MSTRLAIVVFFFGVACAHAPARDTTPGKEDASPRKRHGEGVAEKPVPLPFHLVDGANQKMSDEQLAARIREARVVFVAEVHTNPHDHAVELEVLKRAYAVDPAVALGVEMLPKTMQTSLDQFVAGEIDEAKFLEAVNWKKTWGYPYGLYKPLLEFCREHKLRAFALNAPRSLTHAIAMKGVDGVSEDDKKLIPALVPGPAAHREFVREAFAQHPKGRFSDADFERFYLAQLLWDETMADSVARALKNSPTLKRLVVVAGDGHVRRFAMPERVLRRGVKPTLTIFPLFADDLEDAVENKVGDVFWVYQSSPQKR